MTTVPLTVLLPLPAEVTNTRSGRKRRGFAWFERTVDVPIHESDASIDVPRANLRDAPVPGRVVRGVCADGRHWRPCATSPKAEGACVPFTLRPDVMKGRYDVVRFDAGHGPTACTSRPEREMSERVAQLAFSHGLTIIGQSLLERHQGDAPDGYSMGHPFRPRPGNEAVSLDSGFEAHLLERIHTDLAVVDGATVLASEPPSLVIGVSVDDHRPLVAIRYPDLLPVHPRTLVALFPVATHGIVLDEVDVEIGLATGPNAWRTGGSRETPSGTVSTPPIRYPGRVKGTTPDDADPDTVARFDAWCEDVVVRHDLAPEPAPDLLDALGGFGP